MADRRGDEGQQNFAQPPGHEDEDESKPDRPRLLDPRDGNVTLATLQRAARMVGRSLGLELV